MAPRSTATPGDLAGKGGSVLNAGAGSRIEGERNFGVVISGGTAQLEKPRWRSDHRRRDQQFGQWRQRGRWAFGAGGDLLGRVAAAPSPAMPSSATRPVQLRLQLQQPVQPRWCTRFPADATGFSFTTDVPQYTLPSKTSTLNARRCQLRPATGQQRRRQPDLIGVRGLNLLQPGVHLQPRWRTDPGHGSRPSTWQAVAC